MLARAANVYRRVDLESAPKTQIVERLFDRCVRDIAAARTAIEARDIHAKAAALDHALQIVVELKASLDVAAAPELCANLGALYDFVSEQLIDANTRLVLPPLDKATRIMTELGDAFRKAHAR
ncbi:MAG TPA: flagellar export chaperone FliS [Kofleriaceae bacterium]|jgi:flagellar protein FliS|nr:flagellar export chaperone FliS [Kofleriaceae bacterium]